MTAWVLRATVLGALVVALRVLLGLAMASWPTYGIFWRALCLVAIIAVVVVWGLRDARAGADSLTVRWLAAGFGAGLASSAVCWVLDQVPGIELGDSRPALRADLRGIVHPAADLPARDGGCRRRSHPVATFERIRYPRNRTSVRYRELNRLLRQRTPRRTCMHSYWVRTGSATRSQSMIGDVPGVVSRAMAE